MISLLFPVLMAVAAPLALPTDPVLRTLVQGEAARAGGDHAALLDTAKGLTALGASPAEGQDDLAALWMKEARAGGARAPAPVFRGRALGPAYRRGMLGAGSRVTMRQLFLAGQRARISVAPTNGASRLSMRVQDGEGGTLCAKQVGGQQADCAWLPLFTDRFNIVVENSGSMPAAFYLIVR